MPSVELKHQPGPHRFPRSGAQAGGVVEDEGDVAVAVAHDAIAVSSAVD
jgi:hypothetical protein